MKLHLKLILFMGGTAVVVVALVILMAFLNLSSTLKQVEISSRGYSRAVLDSQDATIYRDMQLLRQNLETMRLSVEHFADLIPAGENPHLFVADCARNLRGIDLLMIGSAQKNGTGKYVLNAGLNQFAIQGGIASRISTVHFPWSSENRFVALMTQEGRISGSRYVIEHNALWLIYSRFDKKTPDLFTFYAARISPDFLRHVFSRNSGESYAFYSEGIPLMQSAKDITQNVANAVLPDKENVQQYQVLKSKNPEISLVAFSLVLPGKLIGQLTLVRAAPANAPAIDSIANAIDLSVERLFLFILAIGFIGLLIFFIPLIYFARAVSEPISRAVAFADTLAGGEFPPQAVYNGGISEISSLVKSLNHMKDRLSSMITKLKRSHDRELQARKDAENANHLKSDFLSNMSLELRNPLNSIMGFSSLILKDLEHGDKIDPTELAASMKTIHESSASLNELIKTLLELSRLDVADAVPHFSEFAVSQLMRELMDAHAGTAAEKHLALENYYSPDIPEMICTDREILYHVLELMFSSLIKVLPDSAKVSFGCSANKNKVLFRFNTSAETDLGTEFKRYSEGQSSLASSSLGVAILNLTIAKNNAHLIGAEFEVATEYETDYKFGIAFIRGDISMNPSETSAIRRPFWVQDNPNASMTGTRTNINTITSTRMNIMDTIRKTKQQTSAPLKILIAEDNDANCLLVEMMLKQNHCTLTSVQNGEKCIEMLENQEFNLLLLDLHMPELDGYSVLKYIRSKRKFDALNIIILTAYLEEGDKEKLIAMGANKCILKPVNMDELLQAIRTCPK